ncbi:MAG: glycosyltransferase family 39 protein [Candidatus Kerfeldbacteria bacterium]|nr:glycosyltransferase family 39 protein [Candidatus Kerfeldbacteria bacterium]
MKYSRWEILLLAIVLLFSIIVRLPAVSYGLPTFEGADDRFILFEAVKIASLERPAVSFGLPDSTLFYSYGMVLRVVFEVMKLFGATDAPTVSEAYLHLNEPWIHETIRIVNIGWMIAGTLLLYTLTRRMFSRLVAAFAILFFSVSSLILLHTIEIRPDVPSIVFVLVTLHLALNLRERRRRKDDMWAGVALGLSVATKYPLALLAIPLVIAHIDAIRRESHSIRALFSRNLWIMFGVSLLTFSIATPLFWPLLPRVIEQLQHEARSAHYQADGLAFHQNLWFYLTHALNDGIGTGVALLAVGGVAWSWMKNRFTTLFLASFPLVTVVGLSFHKLHWDRWMIPVLPFIALFAAVACGQLFASQKRALRIAAVILLLIALPPALMRTLRVSSGWTVPETREVARDWILENALPDSRIVRTVYTPWINDPRFHEIFVQELGVKKLEEYQKENIDYLVINGFQRERFFSSSATPDVYKTYYRETLDASTELFIAHAENGHPIEIYAFSERAKKYHSK